MVIVVANDCLRALLDVVSRTWYNTIETYEVGGPQIRINLLLEWLDGNLVEVYLLTVDIGRAERNLA
jgi:hypothetical protein